MSTGNLDDALHQDLDRIARRGADVIRGARVHAAATNAIDEALIVLVAVPVLFLLFRVLGAGEASFGTVAGWSLSLAALWVPLRAAFASIPTVARAQALTEVDQQLNLADRMTTAAEFVDRDQTPFMAAAVADARHHVERAQQGALMTGSQEWSMSRRGWTLLGAAVALLLVCAAIAPEDVTTTPPETGDPVVVAEADAGSGKTEPGTKTEERPAKEDEGETQPTRPTAASSAKPGKEQAPPTDDVKKTRGKTGAGRSAEAASSSGKGQARGTPSTQGQATKPAKDKTKKKEKKPKKKKPSAQEPDEDRKQEDDSGSTTGRGMASGSNKSPAASEWSSKDQVTSEEDEDLEDDEEVDDEFDISEARGGLQPQLRDRKPPVNRDLSIGFGNAKNPDANGRGGPSEQKKSRGVASLVLGVPIPDHVKGRPNPGKTKITQERVEPQPEDLAAQEAKARKKRTAPVGHLSRPELLPWMQDLVRNYFETLRSKGNQP